MEINEILNRPENEPLELYEEVALTSNRYVFTQNTPNRLKRSVYAIDNSLKFDRNSVDFNDPIIRETLSKTTDFMYLANIISHLGYKRAKELDIPYVETYKKTIRLNDTSKLFVTSAIMDAYTKDGIDAIWGEHFVRSFKYITMMFDTMNSNVKGEIIDIILSANFPVELIPNEILCDDQFLVKFMKYHNMDKNLMTAVYASLKGEEYKGKYEDVLASSTGYSSLEDYIQHEIVLDEKNNPISKITQIAAIRLNTLKQLRSHGIEDMTVIVNEYCVDQKLLHSGGCSEDVIHIYTFPHTTSKERYRTNLHEERHAHQDKAVRDGDITSFPDVDIYSKEKLLREALNYSYYLFNYFTLGIEYDADYTAEKHIQTLEGGECKDEDIDKSIRYTRTYTRKDLDDKAMHIDDLFELVMNREMDGAKSEDVKEMLLDEYPILYYQYNIDEEHGFRKKTPSELLEGLQGEHTEIYLGLIKSSITPNKDKHSLENIEMYETLLRDENISEELRAKITPIIETYKSMHIDIRKKI